MLGCVCPGQGHIPEDSLGTPLPDRPGMAYSNILTKGYSLPSLKRKDSPTTMTVESLKAYLSSRPLSITSAPDLARSHSVDPKTVTRYLSSIGYERSPNGREWIYNVVNDNMPVDYYDLHMVGISAVTATVVDEKLDHLPTDSTLKQFFDSDPTGADLLAMALACLSKLQQAHQLPVRSEITTKGFKPLTRQT